MTTFVQGADLQGKSPQGVRYGGGDEILLQGFHWNSTRLPAGNWYTTLISLAPKVGADGFTGIWMPPPWRDVSSWSKPDAGTSGGGEGYYWSDFDKNGGYGTETQLKAVVAALQAAKVKVIFDVVPNHMNRPNIGPTLQALLNDKTAWRDGCAQCDTGEPFEGSSDLNIGNSKIFSMFRSEFENLRDNYGAAGLRFDFVKGYGADSVNDWMNNFGSTHFCVGELWKGPGEYPVDDWRHNAGWQDALKDWSDRAHCTVFDFALKERLQNGTIAEWRNGLNGNPDPAWRSIAVTFVDNHDTGYSPGFLGGQHHWALPEHLRDKAYAYILSSPGTPMVYWPDMYDWPRGALIRQLVALRRDAGVRADSPIVFLGNYSGLVAKTTGGKQTLLVALGSDLDSAKVPAAFTPALDSNSGDIRIWRSAPQASSVNVQLKCDQGKTQPGESVYAVGSSLELGDWSPARAVRLTDVSQYPLWQGRIDLPGGEQYEWKCIVRRDQDAQVIRWQAGANTAFVAKQDGISAGSF
ncbi:glucan 1,4-alpha-maltotetraohydrolase domain-containing protein [Pseudomonas sp. NR3]|uniref:glucan 1,4-alpha-maltotetraohydrolase domain-containing protein n=1 Tax=Pseudomonas sp. NR3 TaxID=3155978 RepID=UPI003B66D1CE